MQKIGETIRQLGTTETAAGIIPSHYKRFATVEGDQLVFSFNKCRIFMEDMGRDMFGRHFRIWEEDQEVIFKLLVYSIYDRENASRLGLNLRKGIMLTGPVGCGKTSLMNLIRFFLAPQERLIMKSCREISFEFIRNGYSTIDKYSTDLSIDSGAGTVPKIYCFDDLGTEQSLKYYGNECNVMGEILLSRYDQFVAHGIRTFLTTNLSASDIESYYGTRVRSRMREMFNLVAFGRDVKDKRE